MARRAKKKRLDVLELIKLATAIAGLIQLVLEIVKTFF